ncbi:MAG: sigma-54 dependent transcriptional regulator [Calditrichia bacterium]
MTYKILVADNEEKMCKVIQMSLEMENYRVEIATSGEMALKLMESMHYDLVLSDIKMSPINGMELLKMIKSKYPGTEVVMMTAFASQESAVEAMKTGAADYLIKPFEMDELEIRIKRILRHRELEQENLKLKRQKSDVITYEGVIGKSQSMQKVYQLIEKVKDTDATVLIRGESGTGKEVIARLIHEQSERNGRPFVSVNCAAVPETLLESELFGHEKGAFTGAHKSKPGKFELAEDGTLFLDEIGELSIDTQAKLLRVLEDKSFYRLGGLKPLSVKARIIAATNRNLERMVAEKQFREDLFFRLNTFPVVLPPLKDRKEDIPELVWFFLDKFGAKSISKEAMRILMEYDWRGNIRELQNVIYRASILAGEIITPDDLPSEIKSDSSGSLNSETLSGLMLSNIPDGFNLDEFNRNIILKALDQSNGNKSNAAKMLGVTRRRLYSLMEKYKISD